MKFGKKRVIAGTVERASGPLLRRAARACYLSSALTPRADTAVTRRLPPAVGLCPPSS